MVFINPWIVMYNLGHFINCFFQIKIGITNFNNPRGTFIIFYLYSSFFIIICFTN
ncbi:unnamed protein product [Schistosoma mattheei]|uniref:Uncharacterized protein n=1 Tax=Schistosoma mattheei TaxID=31246 RepID=A0A3P7XQS2_9TREM|nr:unnamed protein product [Schistosoma mattheei]